ncbi:MAG TPA: hypothetical protein VF918_17545 [Anaerolineales bacterium]
MPYMVMESINSSTYAVDYRLAMLDVDQKCGQATSGTYAACEQMIQMSFMVMQLGTLDQILERFEKNGRLTRKEHQNLLKRARQVWDKDS